MRSTLLLASLISVLGTGCYFGRSSGHKTAAYIANGAVAVAGTALLLTNHAETPCSPNADSCYSGLGEGLQRAAGEALIGAAIIGTVVNLVVPTRHPEDDYPVVYASTSTPQTGTVTAPGLQSASVTVR